MAIESYCRLIEGVHQAKHLLHVQFDKRIVKTIPQKFSIHLLHCRMHRDRAAIELREYGAGN